jgi:TrmH family RNA methyltransferase
MDEPLGKQNAIVRRLRSLRRDRAARDAERVLVAEGIHLVQEAIASGARIEFVLTADPLSRTQEGRDLLQAIRNRGLTCHSTSEEILGSVQDARSAQPILAVVGRPEWPAGTGLDQDRPPPLVAVAYSVQDPGNLGAMLRTAHAAGASALLVSGDSADIFHPRAVRASMGSVFRLPAIAEPVDAILATLDDRGIATIGADVAASTRYHDCDMRRAIALFLGSEGHGLPRDLVARLGETVRIPLPPDVDSLSVGAAAAVLLFEAARQRA